MRNPISEITFDGDWLALDFTNTVGTRFGGAVEEYLNHWDDLILWVTRAGVLAESELAVWRHLPGVDMAEVRALREVIDTLFRHLAEHGRLDARHVAGLNAYLHEVYVHTQLCLRPEGVKRAIESAPHPEKPLWLIALSAEALLLSGKLDRVKSCDGCGWLFLDTSKNGKRRWCNMQTCGSQSKARNYYHRKKEENDPLANRQK